MLKHSTLSAGPKGLPEGRDEGGAACANALRALNAPDPVLLVETAEAHVLDFDVLLDTVRSTFAPEA